MDQSKCRKIKPASITAGTGSDDDDEIDVEVDVVIRGLTAARLPFRVALSLTSIRAWS